MTHSLIMGYFFVADFDRELMLSEMASRRALLFEGLTQTAMSTYGLDGQALLFDDAQFVVKTNEFCLLVEQVFESPIDLLYVWSTYATGIYEDLKGESYTWLWRAGIRGVVHQNTTIQIEPSHYANGLTKKLSGKTIGSSWPEQ